MPQLRFYVTQDVAETLQSRAKANGKSLSGYLGELVRDQLADNWPVGFFDEVVGGWKGRPLRRPKRDRLERREKLQGSARARRV